jgi:hypothetical protein
MAYKHVYMYMYNVHVYMYAVHLSFNTSVNKKNQTLYWRLFGPTCLTCTCTCTCRYRYIACCMLGPWGEYWHYNIHDIVSPWSWWFATLCNEKLRSIFSSCNYFKCHLWAASTQSILSTCTYHRLFQIVSAPILLLNLVQCCLDFDEVLRIAGGVLVSDDQSWRRRKTLEVHSCPSLRMDRQMDGNTNHWWTLIVIYYAVHALFKSYKCTPSSQD